MATIAAIPQDREKRRAPNERDDTVTASETEKDHILTPENQELLDRLQMQSHEDTATRETSLIDNIQGRCNLSEFNVYLLDLLIRDYLRIHEERIESYEEEISDLRARLRSLENRLIIPLDVSDVFEIEDDW